MELVKTGLSGVFVITILFSAGVLLLLLKKQEKLAKYLLGITLILLWLLSFRPFSTFLIWSLESQYQPIINFRGYEDVEYIVVLSAWNNNTRGIPYTSKLGYRSALRVLEAHRIYLHMDHSKIIISGREDDTKLLAELMIALGVPAAKIAADHSKDTWESAVNLKPLLSNRRFILVTSATHMPRSMDCFIWQGLRPIPSPADYLCGYGRFRLPVGRSLSYYLPNTDSFMESSAAFYEYFGLIWYHIRALRIGSSGRWF
jgi:uncharacterized SAM-binding protein YcdF (DUF218 family)